MRATKTTSIGTSTVGDYLRTWRHRRGISQLDLALDVDISQRHLSFLESGRSVPSRDTLIHLAERLDMPLRERDAALLAAGFAPVYGERHLDDPAMAAARQAIEMILKGHEPFPALAVDRHWHLIMSNAALPPLLAGVKDKALLEAPVNVLRLSLHPQGLASKITNLNEWRNHVLDRLRHQIAATGDDVLVKLMQELSAYPGSHDPSIQTTNYTGNGHGGVLVPLKLETQAGVLSLLSTTTVFGTPRDIFLSEIAIEAFFPADTQTGRLLRQHGEG